MSPTVLPLLIVDDDEDFLEYAEVVARSAGWVTALARSGEEALPMLTQGRFAAAIIDWMLPGMTGVELCRALRREEAGSHYTVLLMSTVLSKKEHYIEAISAGADDFVTKPVDPEILTARLLVAARQRDLRSAIASLSQYLRIRMHCMKIHDEDRGTWHRPDEYLSTRAGAQFTHGLCTLCLDRFYPEE